MPEEGGRDGRNRLARVGDSNLRHVHRDETLDEQRSGAGGDNAWRQVVAVDP